MPFWPSYSFVQQLFLVDLNDISIFSMNDADSAKISSTLKGPIHRNIVNSKHIVVGHEELKAGNTIFNHFLHLAWRFSVPLNYG
jgi:hypothetical protein